MRLLQDMLSNLMRGTMGLSAFGRKDVADLSSEPQQAVKAVLSATGEVSSLVYAENLLNIIEALDDLELAAVLVHLLDNHDIVMDQDDAGVAVVQLLLLCGGRDQHIGRQRIEVLDQGSLEVLVPLLGHLRLGVEGRGPGPGGRAGAVPGGVEVGVEGPGLRACHSCRCWGSPERASVRLRWFAVGPTCALVVPQPRVGCLPCRAPLPKAVER